MSDEKPLSAKYSVKTPKKPRGKAFAKGQSGNPKGRPKGAKNKVTLECKIFWDALMSDPEYLAALWERGVRGMLPPAMETMGWYYAKRGKPTETVQVNVSPQRLAALPPEELTRLREQAIEATAIIARLTTE